MKEVSQAIEKVKQEVQLSEWAKALEQQRQEGLRVDEWCVKKQESKDQPTITV